MIQNVVRECHRTQIDGKFFIINTGHVLLPRASRKESSTRIAVPFDIHRSFVEEEIRCITMGIVEKVISYYLFVNDVVLDSFGGIGTTAMAAASLKRRFVAIESTDDCVETMRSELDNFSHMFNYFEYEYKGDSEGVGREVWGMVV